MTQELATRQEVRSETMEKVLLGGNLSVLTPSERMTYYKAVCESVGLNPLTRPFEYLNLSGKLVLYARREATEQLRKIHGVSIGKLEKTFKDDLYIVEAPASDKNGRTDSSTGAVSIKGLTGDNLANAVMKCETKAKRRVTLSICGLGMLDETEVETIRGAVKVPLDMGEIPLDPDAPTVDLRADVTGGGASSLAPGEIAPPEPSGDDSDPFEGWPEETTPAKPKKDYAFLREAGREKARVGASRYYEVLGGAGYEHASEIIDRKAKVAVFKALQALPTEATS